jgi:hypothetical protein
MIELRSREQMNRAIERARKLKPFVKVRGFRWYEVRSTSSNEVYTLHFYKDGKRRLAECTCKGHERGFVCYHVAAASAVHIGIASMRCAM